MRFSRVLVALGLLLLVQILCGSMLIYASVSFDYDDATGRITVVVEPRGQRSPSAALPVSEPPVESRCAATPRKAAADGRGSIPFAVEPDRLRTTSRASPQMMLS